MVCNYDRILKAIWEAGGANVRFSAAHYQPCLVNDMVVVNNVTNGGAVSRLCSFAARRKDLANPDPCMVVYDRKTGKRMYSAATDGAAWITAYGWRYIAQCGWDNAPLLDVPNDIQSGSIFVDGEWTLPNLWMPPLVEPPGEQQPQLGDSVGVLANEQQTQEPSNAAPTAPASRGSKRKWESLRENLMTVVKTFKPEDDAANVDLLIDSISRAMAQRDLFEKQVHDMIKTILTDCMRVENVVGETTVQGALGNKRLDLLHSTVVMEVKDILSKDWRGALLQPVDYLKRLRKHDMQTYSKFTPRLALFFRGGDDELPRHVHDRWADLLELKETLTHANGAMVEQLSDAAFVELEWNLGNQKPFHLLQVDDDNGVITRTRHWRQADGEWVHDEWVSRS